MADERLSKPEGTLLSASPRVVLFEDFLSPAEVAHVVALGESREWEPPDWVRKDTYHFQFFPRELQESDSVVAAIENRVAAVTGVPQHDGEDELMLARWQPTHLQRRFDNWHHDRHTKPNRCVTVIMYLSETLLGGETLFPAAAMPDEPPSEAAWLLDHFRGLLARDELLIGYDDPDMTEDDMKAVAIGEQLARGTLDFGLKIAPKPGRAVMFESDPAEHAFHGACLTMRGVKYSLQKFKEVYEDE